jgi:hypothetical protein
MRLYRGLKQPYKPEKCAARMSSPAQLQRTDFTDCPYRALVYAHSPRGVVLVPEVGPDDPVRVSEELWLGPKAKRLMVWGVFYKYIRAVVPAKELRKEVRRKGIGSLSDQDKGTILKYVIEQRLATDEPARGHHLLFHLE